MDAQDGCVGGLTKEELFLKEQIENLVGYSLCHTVKIICLIFITFDILEMKVRTTVQLK
jgi:hypothetical protein